MTSEIRAAWQGLRRDTALTLVVVLMLATAIAATTTIFSIVQAVLLRPLPFTDPDRVVLAWTRNDARNAPVVEVSLGELYEWRARTRSLASVDVFDTVIVTPLLAHFFGAARPALAAIFGAVTMLLFIACANAAGLLLVRGVARERETAVRLALGATRAHIVRQFIGEAALLVVLAAPAGLALTHAAFDVVVALSPSDVPRLERASVDGSVLLFALGLAAATPFVVGLSTRLLSTQLFSVAPTDPPTFVAVAGVLAAVSLAAAYLPARAAAAVDPVAALRRE
jgi:ABC-type antimicrobial peptide transport system permease subunit